MTTMRTIAAGIALVAATAAQSAPMVVIGARGTAFKPGQRIDSAQVVTLKPGEQLTLIGSDGRSVTLRGAFKGPALAQAAAALAPRQALAALIAGRGARSSAVGVVRSGADAVATLPDPWLIDLSHGGTRCLRAGAVPILWRSDAARPAAFTLMPGDRSWRADLRWAAGQQTMRMPPMLPDGVSGSFVVRQDGDETFLTIERAPATLDGDLMLAGWMNERGCTQQADALIAILQRDAAAR